MRRVNLEGVLSKARKTSRSCTSEQVLAGFKKLLEEDRINDESIRDAIHSARPMVNKGLNLQSLDPERVYHISHIKKLCTEYRLRYLDAHLFKGDIPAQAISEAKRMTRNQHVELNHFKIIAPASLFELSYQDKDPMLFVPLGDGLHYLIHKWGNDMHPLRKWMVFPFRNVGTLLRTMILVSFLLQWMIPTDIMLNGMEGNAFALRVWMTLHTFIAIAGLLAMVAYPTLKNFNSVLWNSRYQDG